MIRTKPPSDRYRDEWDRIFGGEPEPRRSPDEIEATIRSWPIAHESDCPTIGGKGECRCPAGNL